MEKNQTKPNDIFVATFNAPDANILDFLKNGIDATNTSLYRKEDYANTPFVKKRFTDENGVFKQDEFDKAYEKAYENFQQLADQNAFEGLKEYLNWGKDSIYKPHDAKTQDVGYKAETFKNNPLQQSIGLSGLNRKSDPKLTEEEAAQGNRIWDSKNKKWIDATAENRNIFKKALGETLVYAKYEKDGVQTNPVTGEEGYHYKGEWIKDEDGNYFTETLGDRQLLDKQVVALSDILTEEGSGLNKFDFWDSDGYDKSVTGIAMKTAVQILPYLTPIRGYYGAFTMALQIASAMPALYKSLESIVLGENQSGMTSAATSLENWFAKWNGSKSRKGSESFWNIESLGELAADTFGQLFQQRAAAQLAPKVLAKFDKDLAKAIKYENLMTAGKVDEALALNAVNSIKKMNSVSSGLAFAYMGLTQGSDMYNESLRMGYDRTTAGIVSLATMGSLFGIMKYNAGKNGLGTWFLDKTTGYTEGIERGTVSKLAKEELNELRNIVQKAVKQKDPQKLSYAIREWKRKGASLLHDAFVIGGEELWKGFLVEGTEEVTEEAVQDMVKGLADTMSWLGWTAKEGSFGGWDNVFSKEGLSRYLSTFVGGGFGGALFAAQNKWINPTVDQLFGMNKGKPDANQQRENYELATIILDGRFDEYMNELDNCKKFIKNSLDETSVEEGDLKYNISTQGESQADLVVKLAKQKALTMKNLLESSVGNFNELSNFEKRLVASNFASIFGSTGFDFDKKYLNEQFNQTASKILDARETYAQFTKESKDMTDEEKLQQKNAKEELDAAIEEFKNFFDAKHFAKFSIDGALLTRTGLLESLMNVSLQDYARNEYNIDYDRLEDEELKNKIKEEWDVFQQTLTKENMIEIIPKLRNLYLSIFKKVSPDLSDAADSQQAIEILKYIHSLNTNEDIIQEAITLASAELNPSDPEYEQKRVAVEDNIRRSSFPEKLLLIAKLKPEFLSISPRHDFDLYSAIKPALTLNAYGNQITSAQENLIKQLINEQASRSAVDIWSKDHIREFIESINAVLNDESNIYYMRIKEQRINDLPEDIRETAILNPIDITLDADKLSDNIRSIKINSLQEFANQFDKIDSELKENLVRMLVVDAIDRINPGYFFIDDNGNDINLYEEYFKDIIKNKDIDDSEKLKQIIEKAKEISAKDQIATLAWESIFSSEWISEVQNILNKPVIENKMISLLKKLYIGIHGSNGKDIFDFLANKSAQLNTQEGLNQELSLTDFEVINSAAKTLNLALSVIRASVGTKFGFDPATGLNTRVEGGIIDYGKHFLEMSGEDSSVFKPISEQGAILATGYINDLQERLSQLEWFNRCLGEYKNKLDEETRRQYNIGFTHAILSKEIKIGSISIPAIPKDQIPEDPLECELRAELRLQEIYNTFRRILEDKTFIDAAKEKHLIPEQHLVDAILENFESDKKDHFANPIKKANELCTWDDKNNSGSVNQYWIAKRIVEQIIVDRSKIQEDLLDIQKNIEMYPKFDQMLAMEEMLYSAYDVSNKKGVIDYFNSKVNELNKSVQGQKDNLDSIGNTLAILGGPGSGKTFLLQACKNKLKSILGNFKVSAISKKKVNDLASDLDITEEENKLLIKDLLDQYGLGDIADVLDNASQIITEKWNKEVIQTTPDKSKTVYTSEEFQKKLSDFIDNIDGAEAIVDKSSGLIIGLRADLDKVSENKGIKSDSEAEFYFYSHEKLIETLIPKFTKYPNIENVNVDFNLMVDESTLVHPGYIAILSKVLQKANKMMIISGDRLQQGCLRESGNQKADFTYHQIFNVNHTPMLISSYRFNNNLKTRNISLISSLIEKWESENGYGINIGNPIAIPTLPALKKLLEGNPLSWQKIKSGLNTGRFIGDKIINNDNQFTQDLVNYLVPEINNGKSLAVVSENQAGIDEIRSILKNNGINVDNVEFLTATDIQGGEYDYIISYKLKKSNSPENADLDFDVAKAYTILSRSKFGTLVLDPESDGLFNNSGIKSDSQESRDGFLFNADNSVANNKRIIVIEGIINALNKEKNPEIPITFSEELDVKGEDPVSGNEPDPETDKESDDKVLTEIKDIFFGNGSIFHAYYTRLGIDWRNNSRKLGSDFFKEEPEDKTNLSDLEAFYWANVEKGTKYKGRKTIDKLTIKEISNEFLKRKNALVNDTVHDSGKNYTYRYWCKETNLDTDVAYAKINDDLDTYGDRLQLIQIYDSDNKGWITIGKLGYNKDSNGNIISEDQNNNAKNIGTQFEFKIKNADKDQKELVQKYLNKRNYKSEPNKTNFGFVPYTSLRSYKFNPELTAKQKISPDLNFYNEQQSNFSRLCLGNLLSLGYEIDDSGKHWNPNKNIDPNEFKKWYFEFRLFGESISDDDWKKKFKGLEKRTWIVMKQIGTENRVPVLVNKVESGNYLENIPVTSSGNVKAFGYKQIVRALKYILNQSNKISDDIKQSLIDTTFFNESKILDEAIKGLNIIISSEECLSVISEFLDKIDKAQLSNELDNFKRFCSDHQNTIENLSGGFKGSDFHTKGQLEFDFIKKIVEKLNGFFFTSDTTDIEVQIDSMKNNPELYVVSRIYESPRYIFLWDMIEKIDPNVPNLESLDESEILQRIKDETKINDESIILSYVQLLDPKFINIKNSYINIRGLVDQINQLKESRIIELLNKNLSEIDTELELNKYKSQLDELEQIFSENSIITKRITEKKEAYNARLSQLQPESGMTLDELKEKSEIIRRVIDLYDQTINGKNLVDSSEIFKAFEGISTETDIVNVIQNLDKEGTDKLLRIIETMGRSGITGFKFTIQIDNSKISDINTLKEMHKALINCS